MQQLLFAPYYKRMQACFKIRTKENHEKIKRYLGRSKLKLDEDGEEEEAEEDSFLEEETTEKEKLDPKNNKTELVCVLEKERNFKVENKLVIEYN